MIYVLVYWKVQLFCFVYTGISPKFTTRRNYNYDYVLGLPPLLTKLGAR